MFPHSLRWRIQIWHGLVLVAVLAGFGAAAYRYQWASEMRRVDGELRGRVAMLVKALPPPRERPLPGGRRPADFGFRLPPQRAPAFGEGGYYYVVWRRDGEEWARSTDAPPEVAVPAHSNGDKVVSQEHMRGLFRESFAFTPPGECLLAGRSIAPELAALREYAQWLAAIGGSVLAVGLAGGWWLASRAIRPVDAITATARRIARGELSERIPLRESASELGRLSAVLNETFAQLEESFARQARFTADAAHELRTPVAVILSQAQAALTRERDPAAYQRTLEACVRAARRLQTISESLLDLAAFDAQTSLLQKAPCDLASVARDSAEMLAPLAEARRMPLALDLQPSPCRADSTRIA